MFFLCILISMINNNFLPYFCGFTEVVFLPNRSHTTTMSQINEIKELLQYIHGLITQHQLLRLYLLSYSQRKHPPFTHLQSLDITFLIFFFLFAFLWAPQVAAARSSSLLDHSLLASSRPTANHLHAIALMRDVSPNKWPRAIIKGLHV